MEDPRTRSAAPSTDAANMLLDGNDMLLGGNDMLLGGERDLLAEALPWIAGHCRFVTTNLPCDVVGVSIAAQLLAAIPDACRRRVPDITGSGPDVFTAAVEYGLLAEVPSARVIRSVPKLIADASPIFRRRGQRHAGHRLQHPQRPVKRGRGDDPSGRSSPASPRLGGFVGDPVVGAIARTRGDLRLTGYPP